MHFPARALSYDLFPPHCAARVREWLACFIPPCTLLLLALPLPCTHSHTTHSALSCALTFTMPLCAASGRPSCLALSNIRILACPAAGRCVGRLLALSHFRIQPRRAASRCVGLLLALSKVRIWSCREAGNHVGGFLAAVVLDILPQSTHARSVRGTASCCGSSAGFVCAADSSLDAPIIRVG